MTADLQDIRAALAADNEVLSLLGRGGMATVYLAEDRKRGGKVAIKVLNPDLAGSVGHDRFLREIRIASTLTHPGILTVQDSGEADGILYYVMPYVEGESLRDRLARERERMAVDAVVHTENRIADRGNEVEIVRDHEDGHAVAKGRKGFEKLGLDGKVDVRGRLVEEEDLGFAGQSPGDHDTLALAAGKVGEGAPLIS
jgi:hypothetical protein